MRQRAVAVGLALLCVAVLGHVHLGFERLRIRVVTSAVQAGGRSITIRSSRLGRLTGAHAAVVARVRGGDSPARIRLSIDGGPATEIAVDAGGSTRVDQSALIADVPSHVLTLESDAPGWWLEYLEVANVHGYTDGLVSFDVVPAVATWYPAVPWWLRWTFGLELIALGLLRRRIEWRAARVATHVAGAAVVAFFAVALAAPLATPFALVLSPLTFLLGVAVLYGEPLASGLHNMFRQARARAALRYVPHLLLVLLVLGGISTFHDPRTGFTSLPLFGHEFAPTRVPALRGLPIAEEPAYGYDGQFYAQLAIDPLLRDPATARALDSPAYRARRILLPAVAHVLGAGDAWLTLQVYALLNVVCWLVLGWLLLRWLPASSPAATLSWVGAMACHGLLVSLRLALSDGPAALVIVLALVALGSERRWLTAVLLGAAGLAKETSLIAGSVLLPPAREWRHRALALAAQGALVAAPFALWLAYLWMRGFPGDTAGARNFAWPLAAFQAKWMTVYHVMAAPDTPGRWENLTTMVALTTQAVVLLWRRDWSSPWWRVGIGYVALMAVAGPAVWEGIPGSITRVLLPMTLAFNVLLPGRPWFIPLWVMGNANVLHALAAVGVPWPI
ncbi:MAG: hypothetical protein R2712_27240 [Vicinamibacterales bacterium]